jgi:hypothetical protein
MPKAINRGKRATAIKERQGKFYPLKQADHLWTSQKINVRTALTRRPVVIGK